MCTPEVLFRDLSQTAEAAYWLHAFRRSPACSSPVQRETPSRTPGRICEPLCDAVTAEVAATAPVSTRSLQSKKSQAWKDD